MIVIIESLLDESDLKKYEDHVNNLHSKKEKQFILLRKFNENLSSRNIVDYGNSFVGQYGAGDIQYRNHMSFSGSLIF